MSTSTSLAQQTHAALVQNYATIATSLTRGDRVDVNALATPPGGLGLDEETGYALQRRITDEVVTTSGRRPVGYKVSMTAPEDRPPVNAPGPSYGVLLADQLLAQDATLRLDQLNDALLEPELVFRTTAPLDTVPADAQLAAVLEVTGGIEIPVSRVPHWFPPGQPPNVDLGTFIADNAAAGYVAVADGWQPAADVPLTETSVSFSEADGTVHTGSGKRVMDGPLNSVRWLFDRIIAADGVIPAGTVVSSGTFLAPKRPAPGTFEAAFSHDLGTIRVTFR